MRYLGLALFAEGPTDHRFLGPLLRRLSEDLCVRHVPASVEVGEVRELHSPKDCKDAKRELRILAAAREAREAWHILFVHTDGGGDPFAARRERIEPALSLIVNDLDHRHGPVAVVPVRETEAWAITDGNALRSVFGSTVENDRLGVPKRPKDVESIADPKLALEQAYIGAKGPRTAKRVRRSASMYLGPIGESISLDTLSMVPAFQTLKRELIDALGRIGLIHSGSP